MGESRCIANDCSIGKKGSRKGEPLKQGGALAKFNDWFGSMSLINTLYVWFPASWGLSVVEAISKRNQRWLQQHPVHRDPTMFNPLEVQNGTASRDMRYKIQRCTQSWWLMHVLIGCLWKTQTSLNSLKSYVKEFSGMYSRNVHPRRGKECSRKGSQCRSCCLAWAVRLMNVDFMQRQRQFWPTMTTRHASLAPIEMSGVSVDSCSQSIYGTPSALTGTS